MPLRHASASTPLGIATAVLTDTGLGMLHFGDGDPEHVLERAALAWRTPLTHDAASLAPVFAQLDEYFAGERRDFDIPLDLSQTRGFVRAALETICTIAYGETASYGEVAVRAGAPGAARAVGSACARTPISLVVPAHRVVRADGSIGEYGGDPDTKRFLLDLEVHALSLAAQGER
jgi:methylated-DNA-[protein]-cysteine S-methyltransferase